MSQRDSKYAVDAVKLQERDEFMSAGWVKAIAPAKVNLHLGIGVRREDGYHEVSTVMHAVNMHDVVYVRRKQPDSPDVGTGFPHVRMVSVGQTAVPELPSEDNLATRAVSRLAKALGRPSEDTDLEIRIEKNIPAQAGLGGGSSDAAAALVGASYLWGCSGDPDAREQCENVAQSLGADVAFFLYGGCAYFEGVGERFVNRLEPSKSNVVLVKPEGGVSTAEAYYVFDKQPDYVSDTLIADIRKARKACQVALFNNLAPASEQLLPALAEVRRWLEGRPGVRGSLLCGSGAATFAVCEDFSTACNVVGAARKMGWWARSTSLGSSRAMILTGASA